MAEGYLTSPFEIFDMAYNGVENIFLHSAIQQLEPQYRRLYPDFKGVFDLGRGITFVVIQEGANKGKLTVGKTIDNEVIPHPGIEPVSYLDVKTQFLERGGDMATAVKLYLAQQNSPI